MIELLDFNLVSGAQAVPVSAEPQAVYFRTVAMTGTTPQNHIYDGWGFWSRGTGGDRQCAQGLQSIDLSASANPHMICSTTHCLRLHDYQNNTLSCAVTGADASNLNLTSSGGLVTSGVRVIALAFSGLEDAWCGAKRLDSYPMSFNSGFQPDFAFATMCPGIPNDPVLISTNSGHQVFGVMNATKQAGISLFTSNTGGSNSLSAQTASDGDLISWMSDGSAPVDTFYGEFQATGFEIKDRSGTEPTSGVQTQMVLLLKGTDSTIETNTTPSGTIDHNFTHSPEAIILMGSGNNLWDTVERAGATTAWGQMSQLFSLPGTPPVPVSVHTGRHSSSSRQANRNNMDGNLWGLEAGATPSTPINKYHGELTQFAGQAAQTAWTLDGSGAPAAAFPFILVAIGSKAGVTPGAGGFVPFGPGVFR